MSHSEVKVSAIYAPAKDKDTVPLYDLKLGKACNPTLLSIPQTGKNIYPHLPQQELDSLTNTSWIMEEVQRQQSWIQNEAVYIVTIT